MKKFIALVMSCFFAHGASAESISNMELLKACKDPSEATQNFCYGFIISAANAAQFYRNLVDIQDNYIDICFPETISNKEIVDLYIDWVEKNPTVMEAPAFVGVSTSFSTKYSCSQKEEPQK